MKDYYAILGVNRNAEDVVIKAAYKALAQRYHPDKYKGPKHTANQKIREINEAYEILHDPVQRKKYDDTMSNTWGAASNPNDYGSAKESKYEGSKAGKRTSEKGLNSKISLFRIFRTVLIVVIGFGLFFVFRPESNFIISQTLTEVAEAMIDGVFVGDSKKRQNAGFFVSPTPGAQGKGETFYVNPFSSGLQVQGFARGTTFDAANSIIDQFRTIDTLYTDLVNALRGKIDLRKITLRGLDEEAKAGSSGTFLGLGGNGILQGDLLDQINSFVKQLADYTTGLDDSLLETLRAATTAEEVLKLLSMALLNKADPDKTEAQSLTDRTALQINMLSTLGLIPPNDESVLSQESDFIKPQILTEFTDANMQSNRGSMYANGESVPKDTAEAVQWYKLKADQGYADAQKQLGFLYYIGEGVPQNDADAAKWYRLAAEQTDEEAQYILGLLYYAGEGVPKNDAEAVKWFRLSAAQGNTDALSKLELMYANGEGEL